MLTEQEKQALSDLKNVLDSLDLPMMIVGAGARILAFDKPFNIQGRSTKDWDVAVPLSDWNVYQVLGNAMTNGDSPRFKSTSTAHHFIHLETDTPIDIIPFGKIGEPNQEIEWPSSGKFMNVAGFSEALKYARIEQIDGLELQVVDTPSLVALKLLAWGDRSNQIRNDKDLKDINFIFQNKRYFKDDKRIYEELLEEINNSLDYEDEPIYLLGQDISRIFQDTTLAQINDLLK